ncbi:MAG: CCA tRNA nucleotidyltransferase [Candidatus Omnitrophota bacterium]
MTAHRNISKEMRAALPEDTLKLLERIGLLAGSCGYGAFIVGGPVRDILLGTGNSDLDIAVEGDAIAMGRLLAKKLGGTVVTHKRFGTATVFAGKGVRIDLATARTEIYERPAALPVVKSGSLRDDLMRRDFTINAMAASISKNSFGRLVDFFGGETDLRNGRIRVLHDSSFIDDPTRIFRAVRFEQRFGFVIDRRTERLIRDAVKTGMLDKVAPGRIRNEVILILKEKDPVKVLERMAALHGLRSIHPGIKFDEAAMRLCGSVGEVSARYEDALSGRAPIERWIIYLMALIDGLTYAQSRELCGRFAFRRGETMRILSHKKHGRAIMRALGVKGAVPPHVVYRLLEPLSYENVLFLMARADSKKARSRIKDFFEKYSGSGLTVRGSDLKALGLRPGPEFSRILRKVLYRKIDGALPAREDELKYLRSLVNRIDGA